MDFKSGDTKLERFLPINQHTKRKLLNFENVNVTLIERLTKSTWTPLKSKNVLLNEKINLKDSDDS
jgi:hypothetical protein